MRRFTLSSSRHQGQNGIICQKPWTQFTSVVGNIYSLASFLLLVSSESCLFLAFMHIVHSQNSFLLVSPSNYFVVTFKAFNLCPCCLQLYFSPDLWSCCKGHFGTHLVSKCDLFWFFAGNPVFIVVGQIFKQTKIPHHSADALLCESFLNPRPNHGFYSFSAPKSAFCQMEKTCCLKVAWMDNNSVLLHHLLRRDLF